MQPIITLSNGVQLRLSPNQDKQIQEEIKLKFGMKIGQYLDAVRLGEMGDKLCKKCNARWRTHAGISCTGEKYFTQHSHPLHNPHTVPRFILDRTIKAK